MARALTNRAWWEKRTKILEARASNLHQVEPDEVYTKPGFWPLIKLVFTQYSLAFYTNIMRKQRDGGNWDQMHFIDLCAGSGLTRLRGKKWPGSMTVLGTALIGAHEAAFDHYHFVEPRTRSSRALAKRLAATLPEDKFTVYPGPRAKGVTEIAQRIAGEGAKAHFMAFVDPEGFTEISLPELQPLLQLGRGDLLFNYQYMMVNRAPDVATTFFGSTSWKQDTSDEALRAFFRKRLSDLGRPKTMSLNVAAGKGSGRYAYDMVYAAAETRAGNPWLKELDKTITRRCEGVDGAVLEDWLLGGQQTLF